MLPRGPSPLDQFNGHSPTNDYRRFESKEARSLYQDVSAWMRLWKTQEIENRPLHAVLRVVRSDTATLINFLGLIIDQIYGILQESDGHEVLRQRAETWRQLCFWAEHELPKVSASIAQTLRYLKEHDRQTTQSESRHPLVFPGLDGEMQSLIGQIQNLGTRIKATQEAINSEMALINSKRGIAEAESVTRLTELAFIFVPMTFVAGVFSTQLEELQESPPRAWVFVVTSVSLVAFVYVARLLQNRAIRGCWDQRVFQIWNFNLDTTSFILRRLLFEVLQLYSVVFCGGIFSTHRPNRGVAVGLHLIRLTLRRFPRFWIKQHEPSSDEARV